MTLNLTHNLQRTILANDSNESFLTPDMHFGPTNIMSICCYTLVFFLSSIGNVTMLLILLKNLKKTKFNRVYILLLNLNVADLMVTFFYIPKEIAHNATVQWLASDWLCRTSKYFDVFGIYLSSNILICMSIDRFFAIVRPLYNFEARRRVRLMVFMAWMLAAFSAMPQVYTFCKAYHPQVPWYSQCISVVQACGKGHSAINYVLLNTVLQALEVYILPFVVIVFCYTTIMSTIVNEEKHIHRAASQTHSSDANAAKVQLRRSSHCYIRRAKSKTLRMTVAIVATFLVCWTPYFVMAVLHFVDLDFKNGERLNRIATPHMLEKFFYIFAIFNSCINPYLYGYYSFKLRLELLELCKCCRRRAAYRSARYFGANSPSFMVDNREPRYSRQLSLDLTHTDNFINRQRNSFLLADKRGSLLTNDRKESYLLTDKRDSFLLPDRRESYLLSEKRDSFLLTDKNTIYESDHSQ